MHIEIGDTLTLEDNKKYIVVSMADYKNKLCIYLVNEDATIPMFCYLDGDELVEIENPETIKELVPLFLETASPLLEQILADIETNQEN